MTDSLRNLLSSDAVMYDAKVYIHKDVTSLGDRASRDDTAQVGGHQLQC